MGLGTPCEVALTEKPRQGKTGRRGGGPTPHSPDRAGPTRRKRERERGSHHLLSLSLSPFSSLSATSNFRLTHHHSRVGVSSTYLRYAHTSQAGRQTDRQLAREHGDREGGSSDSMIVVVVIITSSHSPASPAPGVKLCHDAQLLFG